MTSRQQRLRRLTDTGNHPFITDGGLETTLVFHEGRDLPQFAAYPLLAEDEGTALLASYYERYIGLAVSAGVGMVLETPTWRANLDWGRRIGTPDVQLIRLNRASVDLLRRLRRRHETVVSPMVVSGCVGPRGDGYVHTATRTVGDNLRHHRFQVDALADAGVDLVTAITMTHVEEAAGFARAARERGVPCVVSFTVETDGSLPSGQPLGDAITATDALTETAPLYYMVNCAHPTHFADVLDPTADWCRRVGGLRANASRCSHEELDAADSLDDGDPEEFGREHRDLLQRLPHLRVLGGCCGTDHRHVEQILRSLRRLDAA